MTTETVADVMREWYVTDCGARIRSRDFTHDVVLNLSGDFADTDERITYAEHIANTLNSEAAHAHAHAHEVEALQLALDNEQAKGIHTCNVHCECPLCVAKRQIEALCSDLSDYMAAANAEAALADKRGNENAALSAEVKRLSAANISYSSQCANLSGQHLAAERRAEAAEAALNIAHRHIDMGALRVSHYKDAAAIDAAISGDDGEIVPSGCGVEARIHFEDPRYPTLVLDGDEFGTIGYELRRDTGELRRVCICHAHCEHECVCGYDAAIASGGEE